MLNNADANGAHLQEINEEIYKRNLELAVVNKTLSLLRRLYQISLLSLDPASLSEKISDTVRIDLNMELVGIFLYEDEHDSLAPFKFSQSERLAATLAEAGVGLETISLTNVSQYALLQQVVGDKTSALADNLGAIWNNGAVSVAKLRAASIQSHIKTLLLRPLITHGTVIGILLLGLNRSYEILSKFEKDAITSFVDVVAVALDKALLYDKLRIANEKLQTLDRARAEFISIASHQLRTPPATIKWYVAAVLAGDFGALNSELKAALERVESTNNGQISLIDDLLNASRIERGKMEFFFEPGSVEEVTKAAYEQLVPQAEMRKIRLVYQSPAEPMPAVMLDKEKIRQVVNNFIDNAIKYTKQGIVTVHYELTDANVIVKISDNGRGISPEIIPTLFEKYVRGKDSATAATGLGLGLYVAKVVVEQNGGRIWAESPGEGKGATFAFALPRKATVQATSTVDLTAL